MTQMRKFEQEAIATEIYEKIKATHGSIQEELKQTKDYKAIQSIVDELESIDFDDLKYDLKSETDSLKEEVNEVLSNFELMTEGYTVSVKLNPPS